MTVERQPVGIFIAGSKPLFDAGATEALADLNINHEFVGGTGFGAICAAFLASDQTRTLVDKIVEIASDYNRFDWKSKFRPKNKTLEDQLDLVKLRSSKQPIVVGAMNDQFWKIDPIALNSVTDNELLFSILRANNTAPKFKATDRFAFDGGVVDTYPVMQAMMKAGVTKLVLVTSALPETSDGSFYSQYILNARHNELIKSLCLCQAQYPYMQVYLVAPDYPLLTGVDVKFDPFNAKRKDLEIKQGYDAVKRTLYKFNVEPPDPEQTGWAAVLKLQDLADRFVRSTGIEIFMSKSRQ